MISGDLRELQEKNRSKYHHSGIKLFDGEDGVTHINVSKYAKTDLGLKLRQGHDLNGFVTAFGAIGNLRNFLDAVVTPGYPIGLLKKHKLTHKDVNTIPKVKTISLPNYRAIVAYILAKRIQHEPELINLLKDNTLPFTSYNLSTIKNVVDVKDDLLGDINLNNIKIINKNMNIYVNMIEKLSNLIKQDRFTNDDIKEFVISLKDKPEKHLLANSPLLEVFK